MSNPVSVGGDLVKPKGAGDGSLESQYREAASQHVNETGKSEHDDLVELCKDLRWHNDWLMSIRIPGHEITALHAGNAMLKAASQLAALKAERDEARDDLAIRKQIVRNIHQALGLPDNTGAYAAIDRLTARATTAEAQLKAAREALEQADHIIGRYRFETPMGHQPHMIVQAAVDWREAYEAALNPKTPS